jgi:hypothetical protein
MARRGALLEGWPLVAGAAVAAALAVGTGSFVGATADDALHAELRFTARLAFTLFALVFAASPWHRLRPSPVSAWMRRNRRALGLSFFVAFAVHGVLVVRLVLVHSAPNVVLVFGGLAFLLAALMAATSFDGTASLIGGRAWRALHTTGSWYLATLFALAYASRVQRPAYWPELLIVLGLLALRIAARRRPAEERLPLPGDEA